MRESPRSRSSVASGGNTSPQQAGIGRAVVTVIVFALISFALWAWAFEQRGRPIHDYKFLLWGVLVLGLGAASGTVFEFGLRQRVRIDYVPRAHSDDGPYVAWRPVVLPAVGISCAVALLASVNFAIGQSAGTARGVALTVLAIVGGTPLRWLCLASGRSSSLPAGGSHGRTPAGFRPTWGCGRWPPGCCERWVPWSP
jgi:hypothetical protein